MTVHSKQQQEQQEKEASPYGRKLRSQFALADDYVAMNHGSYGTSPKSVLATRRKVLDWCESRPDFFLKWNYYPELVHSREMVARQVNCPAQDLVLILNATTGTNTVLWSVDFKPGDKILYYATTYGALKKTVMHVCDRTGAQAVKIVLEYPNITTEDILSTTEAELKKGGYKVAIIDTVCSTPAFRQPFEKLIALCRKYDCLSLIDGAHGIGCIPLDIASFQPDFLTSNLHKWFFAPRPCALLYVAPKHQGWVHAIPTSEGYPAEEMPAGVEVKKGTDVNANFLKEFQYVGTMDNSAIVSIPAAFDFWHSLGGFERTLDYIHTLARDGGQLVADILGTGILRGTEPGGLTMVNVFLPLDATKPLRQTQSLMENKMRYEHGAFVATTIHGGRWITRLSAQVYLDLDDFQYIGRLLKRVCQEVTDELQAVDE